MDYRGKVTLQVFCLILAMSVGTASAAPLDAPAAARPKVVLVQDGAAQLPIIAGRVKEPVDELKKYLGSMSGADVKVEPAKEGATGIYVGLAADFPWLKLDGVDKLGPEGFILKSEGKNVFAIAK